MPDIENIIELNDKSESLVNELDRSMLQNDFHFIWEGIDSFSASTCGKMIMRSIAEKRPMVTIFICSEGGYTDDARGLLSLIEIAKSSGIIIRMVGIGLIGSAAFQIFSAGSNGWRFVHELSMLMIHASSAELRNKKERELSDYFDEEGLVAYTKIHKRTRERILETGDWYMSPEEALNWGVCDHIIKRGEIIPTHAMHSLKRKQQDVD